MCDQAKPVCCQFFCGILPAKNSRLEYFCFYIKLVTGEISSKAQSSRLQVKFPFLLFFNFKILSCRAASITTNSKSFIAFSFCDVPQASTCFKSKGEQSSTWSIIIYSYARMYSILSN